MKRTKTVITLRDFDFARLMNTAGSEDITEWFSDHDFYLSDIIQERNIAAPSAVEATTGHQARY